MCNIVPNMVLIFQQCKNETAFCKGMSWLYLFSGITLYNFCYKTFCMFVIQNSMKFLKMLVLVVQNLILSEKFLCFSDHHILIHIECLYISCTYLCGRCNILFFNCEWFYQLGKRVIHLVHLFLHSCFTVCCLLPLFIVYEYIASPQFSSLYFPVLYMLSV
jgi:hypothetical protein